MESSLDPPFGEGTPTFTTLMFEKGARLVRHFLGSERGEKEGKTDGERERRERERAR